MTKKCPFCSEEIQSEAIKCKYCKAILKNPSQTKKCPYCAEEIQAEASKCKHCGESLVEKETVVNTSQVVEEAKGLIECPFCHKHIKPSTKQASGSSIFITLILLLFFIVPGIIYMIWDSSRKQCPNCRMVL